MPSYRKKHIKSKIHKIKNPKSAIKLIYKKRSFWIVILSLIAVLIVLYFILFYYGFQLKNIQISGNVKVKTQDISNVVSADSNTKLLAFAGIKIVSRSIFLVNENKITDDILKQFPDIESTVINKSLPQTLILNVTERKAIGDFCPSGQENTGCFLIDQSGVIFQPLAAPNAGDTVVQEIAAGGVPTPGEAVVPKNIMSAIYNIQQNLQNNFQINLTQVLITSPLRMNVYTNKNYKIYFDLSGNPDINSQLSKLKTLLTVELSADEISNLKYIDLRPKDRAITCDNKVCGG